MCKWYVTQGGEITSKVTHISDIIPCKKNLGDGLSEVVEQAVPQAHEPALANGCQSLHYRHVSLGSFL